MAVWAMTLLCVFAVDAKALTISTSNDASSMREIGTLVIEEACRRARLPVTFEPLPLQREVEEANDGLVDGDMHRIADVAALYPNLVMVPTPISESVIAVYGRVPQIRTMTRAEVSKLRMAYPRGHFLARKYSKGLDAVEGRTQADLINMLANERVDAVILEYVETEGQIAKGTFTRPLVLWPHVWAAEPLYMLLNKKNAALVPRIDAALVQMQREGVIQKIRDGVLRKWSVPPLPADDAKPALTMPR